MKRIRKYVLRDNSNGKYSITLPKSFTPLFAGLQDDNIVVWIEVEDEEEITRLVQVVGTGQEVPNRMVYLGTVIERDWHIYMEN